MRISCSKIKSTFLFVGIFAVGGVVAPLVSLVALPIFALKALPVWIKSRSLYKQTLTDGVRAKFGRVEGQDYTRWNGKSLDAEAMDANQRAHGGPNHEYYLHGRVDKNFKKSKEAIITPFSTKEDLEWLTIELERRKAIDWILPYRLNEVSLLAKMLVPLIGLSWAIATDGIPSSFSCEVLKTCRQDHITKHWNWHDAINFHIENCRKLIDQKK